MSQEHRIHEQSWELGCWPSLTGLGSTLANPVSSSSVAVAVVVVVVAAAGQTIEVHKCILAVDRTAEGWSG